MPSIRANVIINTGIVKSVISAKATIPFVTQAVRCCVFQVLCHPDLFADGDHLVNCAGSTSVAELDSLGVWGVSALTHGDNVCVNRLSFCYASKNHDIDCAVFCGIISFIADEIV